MCLRSVDIEIGGKGGEDNWIYFLFYFFILLFTLCNRPRFGLGLHYIKALDLRNKTDGLCRYLRL